MRTVEQHINDHADSHPEEVISTALELADEAIPYGKSEHNPAALLYLAYMVENRAGEINGKQLAEEFGTSKRQVNRYRRRFADDLGYTDKQL